MTRSDRGERVLAVISPVMFTWAAVLNLATSLAASPEAAIRPLLVGGVLALAVFGVCLLVSRSWTLATLLATGLVLFSVRQTLAGLAMLTFALWWILLLMVRRQVGRPAPTWAVPRFVARAAAIFSVALAAVAGWGFASAVSAGQPLWNEPSYSSEHSGGPNVYVILLDGYPREDTLRDTFGLGNEAFIADLQNRGFAISDRARANYNKTWNTLASMFNGTYIDRMLVDGAVPEDAPQQVRWLSGMIQRATVLDAFRDRGYTIRTVPTPFTSTTLTSADDVAEGLGLTEVEARLISLSPWAQIFRGPTLEYLTGQVRDSIDRALDQAAEMAEHPSDQPQLVFTHLESPHTPFVLYPENAEPPPLPECMPTICSLWSTTIQELGIGFDEFSESLGLQIVELNRLTLGVVDRTIAADPSAIVLLLSDHGIRYSLADLDEHYKILLAARTPGATSPFPEDESPVNVLRRVLSFLGEDLSPVEYERWDSDWVRFLDMERTQ